MESQDPPSGTILIAEADRSVRKLQLLFLERAGFSVEFADDGAAALECALAAPPALVITEILVPKLDGLSLCRGLRGDARTSDVPVLVFSILAAAQRAREAGASAFLRKPLVDSTFLAAVQDLIAAQPTATVEDRWASR